MGEEERYRSGGGGGFSSVLSSWNTTILVMGVMAILNYFLISVYESHTKSGVIILLMLADITILCITR